jgi:hypothetical protein
MQVIEIEQLGGRQYVRVIENGNVKIRGFALLLEAETFAESERMRLGLTKVVRR